MRVSTINCNGFQNNQIHLNQLIKDYNIVCVQETWHRSLATLTNNLLHVEKQIFHRFATKSSKKGRGSGGLAFFVDSNLICSAFFPDDRIGILKIGVTHSIIQVYLPFLNYKNRITSIDDFNEELRILNTSILDLQQSNYEVLINGDFNCDFSNPNHNTQTLAKYLASIKFKPLDIYTQQEFNFTYWKITKNKLIKGWPDHVCANVYSNSIKNVSLLGIDNNFGDHRAIGYKLSINNNKASMDSLTKPANVNKYYWKNEHKANIYSNQVELRLRELRHLYNNLCSSKTAIEAKININEMYVALKNILLAESINHMTDKLNKKKRQKWWSPLLSETHIEVCLAYRQYKESNFKELEKKRFYEIKKLFRLQKRALIKFKADSNVRAISRYFSLNKNEFWAKVNKLNRTNVNINIQMSALKDHYYKLFNSPNNIDDLATQESKNNFNENAFKHKREKFSYKLDQNDLKALINDLPNGKSPGLSKLSYEHLRYCASSSLVEYSTKLFETMLQFSTIPDNFNVAIIKPIVKDPKMPSDTIENLRPVAISEVFANLFEKVLLHETKKQHCEADEQFGFKSESSCSHAISVLKILIKLCKLRNKTCYVCALDASKAFDKVERYRLWNKLFEIKLNPAIIFVIIAYYNALELLVQNGNETSERFGTVNGVRQGGIYSPKLYNIYSNIMITKVKESKMGVKCGKSNFGIIMYADDLTLIADSPSELQKLIDLVDRLGIIDDVRFNAKKSTVLIFNAAGQHAEPVFNMNGVPIPANKDTRYLGHQLNTGSDNGPHLKNRDSKVMRKISKLKAIGLISSRMSIKSRTYLFKTYIRPIALDGLDTCNLDEDEVKRIKTIEGNAIKAMVGLNKEMKTSPLMNALDVEPTNIRLVRNKISLFLRLCNNSFTRNILISSHEEFPNDSMISDFLTLVHDGYNDSNDLDAVCRSLLSTSTKLYNDSVAQRMLDEKRVAIQAILKTQLNRGEFIMKMRELIGFEQAGAKHTAVNLRNLFDEGQSDESQAA